MAEELVKPILDLLFRVFPSGFYYKNLELKNESMVNWPDLILQEDPLLLLIHSSHLSDVLRNLVEYGVGPGLSAAILVKSTGPMQYQAIFGEIGEIRTKVKGLQEQDLLLLIHEDLNRIRPFVSVAS